MGTLLLQATLVGIVTGAIYGLVAIGLTLIFGTLKVINFAHGAFLGLAMYISYLFTNMTNLSPYYAMPITILALFIIGLLFYEFIVKPMLNSGELSHVLTTIGVSTILVNLFLIAFTSTPLTISPQIVGEPFRFGDIGITAPQLYGFLFAIISVILINVILKYTKLGKNIQAVSLDKNTALLMGINVDWTYRLAIGIGIAILGLAGPVLLPIYYITPTFGEHFTIISFVVIVLGSLGNYTGAMIGGLIIGLAESLAGAFIEATAIHAVSYAIFIIILLVKPEGLFGKKEREV